MIGSGFTVGDLKRELKGFSDDTKLSFAGGLTFCSLEACGDNEAFIDWDQPQAFLDERFRKRNPNIKVAFVNTDNVEWDESGAIGSIDVSIR